MTSSFMSSFHSRVENGIHLGFIDLPGFHPNIFSSFYLNNGSFVKLLPLFRYTYMDLYIKRLVTETENMILHVCIQPSTTFLWSGYRVPYTYSRLEYEIPLKTVFLVFGCHSGATNSLTKRLLACHASEYWWWALAPSGRGLYNFGGS